MNVNALAAYEKRIRSAPKEFGTDTCRQENEADLFRAMKIEAVVKLFCQAG